MKRVIRSGVFETNSSSMHSVTVEKAENYDINPYVRTEDGIAHFNFGEYGWEYNRYNDPWNKIEYALTMVAETEDYQSIQDFYETNGFKMIEDSVKKHTHCDKIIVDNLNEIKVHYYTNYKGEETCWVEHEGYIDHQSSTDSYLSLQEFLDDYGLTIDRFLFDRNVTLITDNDNH